MSATSFESKPFIVIFFHIFRLTYCYEEDALQMQSDTNYTNIKAHKCYDKAN
jgi:hypothetical protein